MCLLQRIESDLTTFIMRNVHQDDMTRLNCVIALIIIIVLMLVLCRPVKSCNISYVMLKLPILTPTNVNRYPDWHAYYEKVYKEPVTEAVDLNKFTFFYYYSPLHKPARLKVVTWNDTPVYDNEMWIGLKEKWSPEWKLNQDIGFFVHRRSTISHDMIEVLRTDVSQSYPVDPERKVCWFYHTIGSGIFLKIPKQVLVLNERRDLNEYGIQWTNDTDEAVFEMLERLHIDMLIVKYSPSVEKSPRTEIIVRHSQNDLAKTCCDPLPLYRLGKKCMCSNSNPVLNCDT